MKYHQRRPEKTITDREQLLKVLREGNVVTLAMCHNNEPFVTVNYAFEKPNPRSISIEHRKAKSSTICRPIRACGDRFLLTVAIWKANAITAL